VHTQSNAGLVDRLARYDEVVEVGVGNRPNIAARLAERGCAVTATDVYDREPPAGVRFVRDDVTDPDASVYRGADVVYALRCPPELQRPLVEAAQRAGAACLFTPLGGDPAVVAAAPETVGNQTVFRAKP
jgi:uncharacterized UPF0146 family protein